VAAPLPRANFRKIRKFFLSSHAHALTPTVPLQQLPRASRVLPLAKSIAGGNRAEGR
jgi:hypothetical protein